MDEQFVRDLTECQPRLYGLIYSLLPDSEAARDVLQEANVVLWRKADQFEPGTNFNAWAAKVACLQVMAYRSKQRRDRHVFLDDELLGAIFSDAEQSFMARDDRSLALEACLERLPAADRELLLQRYADGGAIKDLAIQSGRSAGALRVVLFRLRHALLDCIERRLSV